MAYRDAASQATRFPNTAFAASKKRVNIPKPPLMPPAAARVLSKTNFSRGPTMASTRVSNQAKGAAANAAASGAYPRPPASPIHKALSVRAPLEAHAMASVGRLSNKPHRFGARPAANAAPAVNFESAFHNTLSDVMPKPNPIVKSTINKVLPKPSRVVARARKRSRGPMKLPKPTGTMRY